MNTKAIRIITASITALICFSPLAASQHKTELKKETRENFETICDVEVPLAPINIQERMTAYAYEAAAAEVELARTIEEETVPEIEYPKLTAKKGVNYGPTGKETWYDLDMSGVLYLMDYLGYSYEDYPYWVREDGVKMFGNYVMVAADLSIFPKGTIVECSLGTAMVVDTGDLEPYQLDIAVDWE